MSKKREEEVLIFYRDFHDFFSVSSWVVILECINELPDDKFQIMASHPFKNPNKMFWMAFPLGVFGVDRFLLEETGLGVVKLLTFGQCLIGFTVDCFTVKSRTKEFNFEKFMKLKFTLHTY